MRDFLIFMTVFLPLAFFNLLDVVRRGEWRYLWVQIPCYAVSLALTLLAVSGALHTSIERLYEQILPILLK